MTLIHTSRLILRQWQESDHEPYIAMNLDPEVMRYFPALQTREATIAQIERLQTFIEENGYGFFAMERKDTGEFIGFTGLSNPHFESFFTPCVEIGWRLARAHWGQGFAHEAARACLDFGFDELGLNEIYAFTSILNEPSMNVMRRIVCMK
jgi:RimJ/RimL family protein N-acetyltransferase